VVGGETTDPQALADALLEGIEVARREGISEEAFERARRKALGEVVGLFDSPEAIAFGFVDAHFKGVSLFDELETLRKVCLQDLEHRLRDHLTEERLSRSVILPLEAAV
jgi:predicted Zn-dependent peptidase